MGVTPCDTGSPSCTNGADSPGGPEVKNLPASAVWEDPTCCRATEPECCNYRSPQDLEPVLRNKRRAPLITTRKGLRAARRTHCGQNKSKQKCKNKSIKKMGRGTIKNYLMGRHLVTASGAGPGNDPHQHTHTHRMTPTNTHTHGMTPTNIHTHRMTPTNTHTHGTTPTQAHTHLAS